MSEEGPRYMWLLVFFDLPVTEPAARRRAARFRKFLLDDGYTMLQWSVYARVCNGIENVDTHLSRLREALPPEGNIRSMQVTDQQYSRIQIMLGNASKDEKAGSSRQLCFF